MPLNGVNRPVTSTVTMTTAEAVNARVQADGDLWLQSSAGTGVIVEIQLFVNGVVERTVRTNVNNYPMGNSYNGWSVHLVKPLAAGTHTFQVQARAIVGSNPLSVPSGHLSVVLFKQ
jgi:hypothetical protein